MNHSPWPMVALGKILNRSEETIEIKPQLTYKQVTVRLWGQGVVLRNEVEGTQIGGNRRYVVRPEQFILSRIDARNGALGLVPTSLDGAVVSNDFPTFDVDRHRLEPRFLEWLSKTGAFVDMCRAASEGTTNRVRLKVERFMASEIPLPPLAEQRRIVARIEALAAKVKVARGLWEQIEEKQAALLHSLFKDVIANAKYRPVSIVAPIVRRWIDVNPEQEYSELGVRSFGKGTFHKPAISGADLGTKRILSIEPGDLIFMNVFAWEGAIAVAQSEDVGRVGSHRYITCVPKEGTITAPFLRFYFLTPGGLSRIGEASPGGAGRNRTLGIQKLEQIEVPVPDYNAQLWFDRIQLKTEMATKAHEKNGLKLANLLPSILNRAFEGRL